MHEVAVLKQYTYIVGKYKINLYSSWNRNEKFACFYK